MKRIHLLGHPVSQSLSPVMQNAAFKELGLDWEYSALDIQPNDLVSTLERLEADREVVGCNVTVPHKIAVFEWLGSRNRGISGWASRIGAVNTLFRGPDGLFQGTSTDFQGAWNTIRHAVNTARPGFPWAMAEIAILGTGGSAQTLAVGFASTQSGPIPQAISIYGRNLEKAAAIATQAGQYAIDGRILTALPLEEWSAPSHRPRIVCQTTTVGMSSGESPDQSPVPAGTVTGVDIAFDLVYKPHLTRFLSDAQENKALVVHGIGMLIGQGAQAAVHWLDASFPDTEHANLYPKIVKAMDAALQSHATDLIE